MQVECNCFAKQFFFVNMASLKGQRWSMNDQSNVFFAKLTCIFVANATFLLSAFGGRKGSDRTCGPALAIEKGQLRIHNGQLARSHPLSMGMPIAPGSLPVSCLADATTGKKGSCECRIRFDR